MCIVKFCKMTREIKNVSAPHAEYNTDGFHYCISEKAAALDLMYSILSVKASGTQAYVLVGNHLSTTGSSGGKCVLLEITGSNCELDC